MIGNTKKNYDGVWCKYGDEAVISYENMADAVMQGDWHAVMLDGPSGCGKSYILHRLRDVNTDKTVKIIPARDLADELIMWIVDRQGDAQSFADRFNGTDVLCIEDADMDLRGKEATQTEIAEFVKSVVKHATVIITGIDLRENLPVLYDSLAHITDTYCFTEK